jgi:hypothetical protein
MADRTDDGGPAFPREDYQRSDAPGQRGMSLRDYFASQALEGGLGEYFTAGDAWTDYTDFAESCYRIADAMLKARAR